jgi:hypothetical protein
MMPFQLNQLLKYGHVRSMDEVRTIPKLCQLFTGEQESVWIHV